MNAQKPTRTIKRASRKRFAAALCTAGIVAVTLSGNLLSAGADDPPAPGDPAAAPPTQVAPDQASGGGGATATTTTATTPATTTQAAAEPPANVEQPAAPAAPAPAQTSTTPDPARAPAPARTTSGRPQSPAGLAGPVEKLDERSCPEGDRHAERKDDGNRDEPRRAVEQAADAGCDKVRKRARRTISPDRVRAAKRDRRPRVALRNEDGVPTVKNPTTSVALPGPIPVGVPNFFIDKFRIPPFLLPIYQAAGMQYGVRWEILAAINEIETDYGRNLNISSAGALGWMQFMPQTWKAYGTDANRDGRKDPFNPVDAIFAAARYLKAAGAGDDLRRAIFAYNHADWYVESVLMRARLIGGLPIDLVGSLSGLTQGHFPVYARARYADDIAERQAARTAAVGTNPAMPVDADVTRRGIDIFAKPGSPVIAVQDGTITAMGRSERLGRYVRLRDVYGNTYTYAHLKRLAAHVPVPKPKTQSRASIARELALPKRDPKPTHAASAGRRTSRTAPTPTDSVPADTIAKERLFAHPARRNALRHGGRQQILELESLLDANDSLRKYFTGVYGLDEDDVVLKPLTVGRRVIAGTILGRIGRTSNRRSSRLHFEIRPAGRGAPRIDPKPILDGWKLLESTAIYRAQGRNALVGGNALGASIGQIMLMSKEALIERVLANPRIDIYSCGRRDIQAGSIDRRVLATLEFLAASGLKPTVTSLTCGHGFYTASGNVSDHSSGNAVDIAMVNGIPMLGNQGEGSITDITIRRLLTLQGTMKPRQIISLMTYQGTDNTLAMGDHADHIHLGFRPAYRPGAPGARQLDPVLKPAQWTKLIDRLGEIDNPTVSLKPSKYAIRVPTRRASTEHHGE